MRILAVIRVFDLQLAYVAGDGYLYIFYVQPIGFLSGL